MKTISFSKYSSSGNDFILIDNRENIFSPSSFSQIEHLCNRHEGIGADGLILLEKSYEASCKMIYFNADGREAAFCGNGLRAIAHFNKEIGNSLEKTFSIETATCILKVMLEENSITTEMPLPSHVKENFFLENIPYPLFYAEVGVPHVVLFLESFDNIPFLEIAKNLRFHPFFGKEGANVNFILQKKEGPSEIKTYERGVEDFTKACGSGVLASAYFIHKKTGEAVITLEPESKKALTALFFKENSPPFLKGNPVLTFKGFFSY